MLLFFDYVNDYDNIGSPRLVSLLISLLIPVKFNISDAGSLSADSSHIISFINGSIETRIFSVT